MNPSVSRRWLRARRYLEERQFAAAHVQWDAMRASAPEDVHTHILGAQLASHEGHPQAAALHALAAARATDGDPEVAVELIETLRLAGELRVAHEQFAKTAWDRIDSPDLLFRYADLCQRLRRHAQALAALDHLIELQPDQGRWHFERGHQLECLGRLADAEGAYVKSLALTPNQGRAAYSLVRLRRQTPADDRLEMIREGLHRVPPGTSAQADFEFARYHVLDDLGQADEAWQALAHANSIMGALMAGDVARQQEGLARFCHRIEPMCFSAARTQADGPRPIFIVGMPRSGTTVLERLLANHSQVAGAGELTDFARQLLRVADTDNIYNESFLDQVPALDLAAVGAGYVAQSAWRAAGKSCYVDKQPANWLLAGLMHAALPQAKILHLVRDPMDTCFSLWRARFAAMHGWSYAFEPLAARFIQYRRWMRHWNEVFPGAILEVDYAALVGDTAATLQRIIAFCGLDWEPGCEDLTHNDRPVSTLSSAQVRQPVNAHGVGHWRRYAEQLEPLRRLLESAGGAA